MTAAARSHARTLAPALAAVLPVAVAIWVDGGYGPAPRVAFALAAALGFAVAVAAGGRLPLREPVVLVLLGLAALGALSALWTLGPADRTLRWAAVTAGYAAVVLTSAAAARRHGAALVGGVLAALAALTAVAGLVAAVALEPPYALRIAGVWRPAGPFEYPPALALLQVSALPALLAAMTRGARPAAAAAALGMALAGSVLALSASRTALAMAVAVGGFAIAFPAAAGAGRRAVLAGALVLGGGAGLVMAAAAGAPQANPTAAAVAALAGVTVLAAPAWLAARPLLMRLPSGPPLRPHAARGTVAVLLVAVVIGALAFGAAAGRGAGPPSDFLHGRSDLWRAAAATFADRPLHGTGAGAFLAGSARHQDGETIRFAHQLPLELAAELGVAGLVLALALYLAGGRAIWRARDTPAAWLAGPAVAAFLVASLVDWPWHLAGAGAVWALALGALVAAAPGRARLARRNSRVGHEQMSTLNKETH